MRFKYDSERWVDSIPAFIEQYNKSVHTTIGTTPNRAVKMKPNALKLLRERIVRKGKARMKTPKMPKLKVGSKVRTVLVNTAKKKVMGHRGSEPFWSKTRHDIIRIYGGDRPKYKLRNKKDLYFRNELQLADEIKHKKEYKDRPVMSKLLDRERSNKAPKPKKSSDLDPHWWRKQPTVVHKPDLDLMDSSDEVMDTPAQTRKKIARADKRRLRAKAA